MSSIEAANAAGVEWAHGEQDLGPLAWVLDELRKSLDGAAKAMRRFVRDAELARESDLASLDAGPLRIARQQLHQACGALEMVGMGTPTLLLRAMETVVQKYVQRPEQCSDDAAAVIERASFALVEYLESVLAGKPVSPVALFPQYRDVQALAGAERVHPADLWPAERRLHEPAFQVSAAPLPYGPEARARLDSAVLRIVKSADPAAAAAMRDTCLGFVAAQTQPAVRTFWRISAAFFEAMAQRLLPADVYVKRVASRVLLQYAAFAKGEQALPDRLVQDLLFFCAQAQPAPAEGVSPLSAVRETFQLNRFRPVDYETARFGRFDPALLAQARKRIAAATETWSALAGGDRVKLKPAADQFSLVCDSLNKLLPGSDSLARALTRTLEATVRSGEPPAAALAMEVATSVLYLQATFEDLDASDTSMVERASRLAERLEQVLAGAEPAPLEPWMEELYRRVSDRQTMGSVVDELRATLAEAEKCLDQFFRAPEELSVLSTVPGQLAQMRGVLSVLGLDQASLAVARMRETVERLLINEVPQEERQPVFEKLGSSLGALGFLIDMLGYQRAMARKLFVYDEEQGELRVLMGRTRARVGDSPDDVPQKLEGRAELPLPEVVPRTAPAPAPAAPVQSSPAPMLEPAPAPELQDALTQLQPEPVAAAPEPAVPVAAEPVPAPAPMPASQQEEDDELLDIFLEEAREVVTTGLAALAALEQAPGDLSEQTTLRRAFHTLKGSSRMVGLTDFGEAGWAMEQMLNAWLAEQKPMPAPMQALAAEALRAFGEWVEAIAQGPADAWQPEPFRVAADAMRLRGERLPLALPALANADATGTALVAPEATEVAPSGPVPEPEFVPELPEVSLADAAPQEMAPATEDGEVTAAAAVPAPEAATELLDLLPELDFAPTEVSPHLPEVPTEPSIDIVLPDVTEDIDFSVFSAAGPETIPAAEEPQAVVEIPAIDLPTETQEQSVAVEAQPPVSVDWPQDFVLEEPVVAEDGTPQVQPGVDIVAEETPPAQVEDIASTVDALVEPMLAAESAQPESLQEDVVAPEPEPAAAEPSASADDSVKAIGSLRIGVALYNVYLGEADEWSRRLEACLRGWSHELHHPVPDQAVALAHSLAGSSATVGFTALSEMARLLEHALQHVQLQPHGLPEQAQVFVATAEDICRLLHQFAAGFLKTPQPQLMEALRDILNTEISSGMAPLESLAAAYAMDDVAQAEEGVDQGARLAPSSLSSLDADRRLDDAIAQAVERGSDLDDDIDVFDVIDPDLFPIFEEEATELFPALGAALRQWAGHPQDMGSRSVVLRALHTLKGSSRLAGAMRLGEMAHRLETAVEQIGTEDLSTDKIEPLLAGLDSLQASFEVLRVVGAQEPEPAVQPPEPEPLVPEPVAVADAPATAASQTAPLAAPIRMAAAAQPAAQRTASGQSVRVRAQLLDRLVNQAGEVLIARSRLDVRMKQVKGSLDDLSGNLERLRQQLRDIEVQAESQMQSRLALSKDSTAGFDPLEFDRFTRVQELTRMMAESVNDVATVQRNLQRALEGAEDDLIAQGRQARELQRDLLRTRMVEFESIAERLYAVVRQSSKELGKQIKLDIAGGTIELDRSVLDRMTPAFEHLLRNCVSHGIEMPEERTARGKPATGTITVGLRHEGNDVSVEFRDDGAGLNIERIRAKAVSQGLIAPDAQLSETEAAQLIFMQGFSTATEVTGLSGRGVGMDVVRSEVNALGGRIETTTASGQGSSFRMVLPLTTAVTQVVMLRSGDLSIGIPANLVEIVRRTPLSELEQAYRSGQFREGGEMLPFFWSGALLQSSARSLESAGKTRPVVVLRSASQRLAMHVDEVLGNQEIVVKNLGPQLSRLPGLAGMSVLASGAVVLVYNPVALANVYGETIRQQGKLMPAALEAVAEAPAAAGAAEQPQKAAPQSTPAASQVPLVLVVDDSITVRRVTQRLLQREGYRVALAADGLQALERLQEERPTVVLSDIEMPRMDGFDLARNIRGDAALHDLPIIMITSRIAEKHREHALELGVNHYLGKPYSDEELLGLVKHYAAKAAALAAV